jgi:hypothetical protein
MNADFSRKILAKHGVSLLVKPLKQDRQTVGNEAKIVETHKIIGEKWEILCFWAESIFYKVPRQCPLVLSIGIE